MSDAVSEHTGEVDDSWAQVLAKLEAERSKVRAQEVTGRGAKRKAAPSFLPKVSAYSLTVGGGLMGVQKNSEVVIGSDGSSVENSPGRPRKKGKKKPLDREEYSASVYSSDGGSESGTDAGSVVADEPLVIKKTKRRGLAHDHTEKLNENYCGLCGTTHVGACHMAQNVDGLVMYRAMLMEVTNDEPIEIRVSGFVPGPSISALMSYTARSSPSH